MDDFILDARADVFLPRGKQNLFFGEYAATYRRYCCISRSLFIEAIGRITHHSAARIHKALAELEGSCVLFEFTSGDRKRISEIEQENRKQGKAFVIASAWNLALNLIASIVYSVLFTTVQS